MRRDDYADEDDQRRVVTFIVPSYEGNQNNVTAPEHEFTQIDETAGSFMKIKIILFDMMDTLIHEPYFDAIGRLLPPELDAKTYFRWRDTEAYLAFERGEASEQEHFRQFYLPDAPPEMLARFPRPERVKKELLRSLRYIAGIPELIAWLRARGDVRLGVASNYSVWYQDMLPRLRELRDDMDYYFYSCEMGIRKPDAGYFEMIAAGLRRDFPELSSAEIFFTDDRQENVEAARACGWQAHLMDGDTASLRDAITTFL
ncbi:MAG: hypothetical protein NXI24_23820 [bacterium]|nr:hypothetical protein [bacterium]